MEVWRNILVASELAKVKERPNLGNIIESVLSADVFARYCRMRGHSVMFVGGTDDSGITNNTDKTEEEKQKLLTHFHNLRKKIHDWFNIRFDVYGGTSLPDHSQLCQQLFNQLLSQHSLPPQATLEQLSEVDAPLGYISITKSGTSEWRQWWQNPENVELHQFTGHDSVKLHSMLFPLVLIGTRESWSLPSSINATKSLNFGTGHREVFGDQAKHVHLHRDVWRYYLMSIRPEVIDSVFAWDDLITKLNQELTDHIAQFINAVLRVVAARKGYGYIVPDTICADIKETDVYFGATIGALVQEYIGALEKARLKEGLEVSMKIAQAGLKYFQEEKVRHLYKKNRLRCSFVVKTLVGVVYILARLLEPYMPTFSAKVLKQLDMPRGTNFLTEDIVRTGKPWEFIPCGHKIGKPKRLFGHMSTRLAECLKRVFSKSPPQQGDCSHSTSLKGNLKRGMETGLRRCSTVEQSEIGKKDTSSNQVNSPPTLKPHDGTTSGAVKKRKTYFQKMGAKYSSVTSGKYSNKPQDGTTSGAVKKRKTYFQKMGGNNSNATSGKYSIRKLRTISPSQAARLRRGGMQVQETTRVVGTYAFTNWRDASSIQIEIAFK